MLSIFFEEEIFLKFQINLFFIPNYTKETPTLSSKVAILRNNLRFWTFLKQRNKNKSYIKNLHQRRQTEMVNKSNDKS